MTLDAWQRHNDPVAPRKLVGMVAVLTALMPVAVSPSHAAPTDLVAVGSSVAGREIRAKRLGSATSETVMVVIGQMHGDERAGPRVVTTLRHLAVDERVTIWVVPSMNPDGFADNTRTNVRHVDLNRNFPSNWRRTAGSGSKPASEPETSAMTRWLDALRPDAVISLHQPFGAVDLTHERARPAGRALARWMGVPARIVDCDGPCRGTLTQWVDRTLEAIAVTVELGQRPDRTDIAAAARAITRLGTWLAEHQESRR